MALADLRLSLRLKLQVAVCRASVLFPKNRRAISVPPRPQPAEDGRGHDARRRRGWLTLHKSGTFVQGARSRSFSWVSRAQLFHRAYNSSCGETISEFRKLFCFPEAKMSNFVALIVEDDPFQRACLADLLKSEGLEVVECANGEVAELVLASTGPELRALVTNLELGGEMSGADLAQYAKRRFPGLNVVMVSGHAPPYVPQDTLFLMMPYKPKQLLDAVLS